MLENRCRPISHALLRSAGAGALITVALLLLARFPAAAEEVELVTDRPDQTESTAIVPPGHVQVELGATYLREDFEGFTAELLQVPGTLARIGLSERFELRVGWEGWLEEKASFGGASAREDGFGDAELGAKLRLREGDGLSPAIALLAATSLPVGERDFSKDRFDPSMRISVSHDFASGIGIGYNAGVEARSERREHGESTTLTHGIYTLAAGFPAGERCGLFVEVFGEVPLSAEGGPAHLLDGGVTYLLRPNLQLDAAAGAGLNDHAPDWFAGIGVSFRLPG